MYKPCDGHVTCSEILLFFCSRKSLSKVTDFICHIYFVETTKHRGQVVPRAENEPTPEGTSSDDTETEGTGKDAGFYLVIHQSSLSL
jgi:hypothetical protein